MTQIGTLKGVILTGLLGLLLLVALNPAPTAMANAPVAQGQQNRILADMRTRIEAASSSGHCIEVESGLLTISVRARVIDGSPLQPVRFTFSGYRGLDQHADTSILLNSTPSNFDYALSGGMYCYALRNEAVIPPGASISDATNLSQWVDLRLELTS